VSKPKPEYVQNRIFQGFGSDRYYFVKRAQRVGEDSWLCVTNKIDVTESVEALLADDRKKRVKRARKKVGA
jgi:hypothetical protein